jgi:hypothetical protein
VPEYGGRIIKLVGDGSLSVFEPGDAADAVACVTRLRDDIRSMSTTSGLAVEMGANVHLATVALGTFGTVVPTEDVIGFGVIHTHRMGGGEGFRISEPVSANCRTSGAHRGASTNRPRSTRSRRNEGRYGACTPTVEKLRSRPLKIARAIRRPTVQAGAITANGSGAQGTFPDAGVAEHDRFRIGRATAALASVGFERAASTLTNAVCEMFGSAANAPA